MSDVHLHLMLNHLPVVGTFFAVMLLAWALLTGSDQMKRAAFGAFILIAAIVIPTFRSGDSAQMMIGDLPGVTDEVIAAHEFAAKIAYGLVLADGVLALTGLWVFLKKAIPRWYAVALFALSIGTAGVLAWTANLGGKIRHTEIRAEATAKEVSA